jgi:hypothetical protein
MYNLVLSLIIGIVFIFIGVSNLRGNIKMLHSYHRDRVKEEDKKPLGKILGVGMIILAVAIMINGVLTFLSTTLNNWVLEAVGLGILIVGLAVGLGLTLCAIKKYNGKIF